ncbi:flagellar hook-length control protein FliK [Paenibacillus senegalensis]|uniref:flagellar hook-length control protein FliK n=1 Tax=Paenibacillus senegalensis TaxID=1465766 RepID=UPI00028962BB|nr:flagellar hook-length control protein FliK [Paenibacillus senegalensis]
MSTIAPMLFFTIPSDGRQGYSPLLNTNDGKFADVLNDVVGGREGGQAEELADSSLLLPLLAALRQTSESEGNLPLAEKPAAEQLLRDLIQWLNDPQLLEPMTRLEGFEEWIVQTNALLAASGWMESIAHSVPEMEGSTDKPMQVQAQAQVQAIPLEISRQTLQHFLTALEQQPESALLAQLKDKLVDLLSSLPRESVQTAAARSELGMLTGDTKAMGGNKVQTPEMPQLSASDVSKSSSAAGKNGAEPAIAGQLRTTLELAQKTDMLARLEALSYRNGVAERLSTTETASSSSTSSAAMDTLSLNGPAALDAFQLTLSKPAAQPAQPLPTLPTMERFYGDLQGFVLRSLLTTKGNGVSEAKIALYPEHLGHVDVKITLANGQLTAQLTAHTMAGKEILETQLAQLRANLQNQGIQVERLDVTHADNNLSHAFHEQRQQSSQQFSGSGSRRAADNDFLEGELSSVAELGSIQKELYGNEFNATV